ncbi:hypothetical protein [Brevundimonas sp. TWP2-3-4b1]|uniref:hypothetical protein n=1 Tax=Brevundimonas sp. TWP2-3-4b1 TaxID=2804580 RepID=UPI003CFB7613
MLDKLLTFFKGSGAGRVAPGAAGQADANAPLDPAHAELIAGDERRNGRAWSAAARHYRAYLKDQPEDFAIWVQLGHALKEDHRLTDADDAYGEARRLRPANADLLLNHGHLKKLRGNLADAAALYMASAEIQPGSDVMLELQNPLIQHQLSESQRRWLQARRPRP